MNAPYDGDRDSAGQMPPSPEQRPAPADPYLQNTYAYDPYQQQDPAQAQWQQQPQPGYQEQQGQEYDAFDHLFRDQQPQGGQQQAGYQQPYPEQQHDGYQQPYPQQQGGYDPR